MKNKIKDWKYTRLDSGHWIAICGNLESPIACKQQWCRAWVKSFCKGKTVFI